ncbi:MAG: NAD(P)H-dependent oxidoreductase [Tannerella sp.]|jgi:glutathione-regulated potassium-efflux system ancillary protein KefG|nr:NAD(P)H-dependent oxidoreductase [Tannerella sp.]
MKTTGRRNFLGMAGLGAITWSLGAAGNHPTAFPQEETHRDRETQAARNGKKTVILLAHPDFKNSKANRALAEAVKDIEGVSVTNLYEAPFTAETYRKLLSGAGSVVFQFPFYWASAPSQLKKWCDELFIGLTEQVKGVKLLVATTTGSEYDAYRSGGRNRYTLDELLRPYQLLANHSGMIWQTPFAVYGVSLPTAAQSIAAGALAYREKIEALANG